MNARTSVLIVLAGLAAAVLLAVALGETVEATVQTIALALGGALVAGVVGTLLMNALAGHSLRAQHTVMALTAVTAVALGGAASASVMFLSSHDFGVLMVILVTSGTVGVLSALMLADRFASTSRSLGQLARSIGEDHGSPPEPSPGSPGVAPTNAWASPGVAPTNAQPAAGGRRSHEFDELRRELEATSARLGESRARERALDSSRRELVAWVSHDLRTPLAGIRALTEALEDQVVDDPETVARYHRTIRLEADRLAGLVNDLFELSRIEAGALPLAIQRVSLADLVSDALAGAAPAAEAKGVRLQGSLDGAAPEVDLSIPEVLRVLRNLLDNAIRHTPPGGEVGLQAGVEGDRALVSVKDECGGIPEQDLDRVFDTAFRGDEARTPADEGAGLGLAIARGLVQAHQGDIEVHNEDRGCRFTVRLPLSQPQATEPHLPEASRS